MKKALAPMMAWLLALPLALSAGIAAAEDADDNTLGLIEASVLVDLDRDPPNATKFEEFRDVPNGLVLDRVEIDWFNDSSGFFIDFGGVDMVQDDQQLSLNWGKYDLFKIGLNWSENPFRYGDGARSLWTHQGGGVFTLDPSFIAAVSSAPNAEDADSDGEWDDGTKGALIRDALAFNSTAIDDLGYQRRTGEISTVFTPNEHWRLGFTGAQERRTGTTPQTLGGYFSVSPNELAAPLDYETNTLNLFVEYTNRHFNADVRYVASEFNSEYHSITWDDARFAEDSSSDSSRGRLYTSSDNEMHRWSVHLGGNIPAGNTRIDFSASQTETTQDDPFLPKTINSMLSPTALGRASYDGEHQTDVYDLRFKMSPSRWFSLKGWWRQFEFDDQSPSITLTDYVEVDRSIVDDRRRNLPYRYKTSKYGLAPSFRPADWATIGVSYEHAETDRTHAAVVDSEDDTWALTADFLVTDWFSIFARYTDSERRAHEWHAHWLEESFPDGESNVAPENEAHREFFWTDRDREEYSLKFEVTPTSKFAIYAEAIHAKNRYMDPNTGAHVGEQITVFEDRDDNGVDEEYSLLVAGRERDKQTSYTLGFMFDISDHFRLWLDHTWEAIEWSMASRYRNISGGIGTDDPLDDWFTHVDDDYRTLHFGLDANWSENRWEAGLDVTFAEGRGDILTDFVEGGNSRGDDALEMFPQLQTDFTYVRLDLMRNFPSGWSLGFGYWYEEWDAEDWQTDILAPYVGNPDQDSGSSTSMYLGTDYADYENNIFLVTAKYRF